MLLLYSMCVVFDVCGDVTSEPRDSYISDETTNYTPHQGRGLIACLCGECSVRGEWQGGVPQSIVLKNSIRKGKEPPLPTTYHCGE